MKLIVKKYAKKIPKLRNPVFIEGLPGIGNVGKIAIDYMVEELKPKQIYKINSYSFPHSVFINDNNLIDLPSVDMYLLRQKDRDFLLMCGDVQPLDESSNYEFCDKILDMITEVGCKEVITLGGIGLPGEPKNPIVFGTANNKKIIKKYKKYTSKVSYNIGDNVGTIVGASGLLLGLASLRNIDGIAFFVETFGNPYHVGLREAKHLLDILNKMFGFNFDLNKFEEDIKKTEKAELAEEEKEREEMEKSLFKKLKKSGMMDKGDTNYIG